MQAKGRAYENKVRGELERRVGRGLWEDFELLSGQWLHFRDSNGNGFAQPDFILLSSDLAVILDAKLSHTILARPQLEHLYRPLVQFFWKRPVTCVEVCHNAAAVPGGSWIRDLDSVFDVDQSFLVWHWLGL